MAKNKLQAPNNKTGFTLIEIIIVTALTLFLLTVTIQGFANSSSQFTFNNEADKIQAMIRTARSLAISGKAQLDYTDFNNNGCTDDPLSKKDGICDAPEYVTPANYGVQFFKYGDTNSVTLFVDNHSKKPNQEGKYEMANPHDGYDFLVDYFLLPQGLSLIMPNNSPNENDIFFSPIFADVSSYPQIDVANPFFTYGVQQKQGAILRKRCWQIHMLTGISEQMNDLTPNEGQCP